MKIAHLFISILFFPLFLIAADYKVVIAEDQILSVDYVEVDPSLPTIILLPGINRSLTSTQEKEYFQYLQKQQLNILSIATSAHPKSIAALPAGVQPAFLKRHFTLQDFAIEVQTAVTAFNIKYPIAVSLSYSSAILAHLDSGLFKQFIEMVPMGDPLEGQSAWVKGSRDYQELLKLNPFFGESFVRSVRDSAYRSTWTERVQTRLRQDSEIYGVQPRINEIIEGYVTLSRAAEDYRLVQVKMKTARSFIVVEGEQEERLKLQLQSASKESKQSLGKMSLIVVAKSEHILPSNQPEAAAMALKHLVLMHQRQSFISGKYLQNQFVPFSEEEKAQLGL